MTGSQFVTDEKGRKVGVLIDLKKHGAIWEDFWDGLVSESRRKEKGIPYEQYRASRLKRSRASNQAVGSKGIGCAGRCAVQSHRPEDFGARRDSAAGGMQKN